MDCQLQVKIYESIRWVFHVTFIEILIVLDSL